MPDDAKRSFLLRLYGGAEKLADQWIVSAAPKNLESACQKVVDIFYYGKLQDLMEPRVRLGEATYGAITPQEGQSALMER